MAKANDDGGNDAQSPPDDAAAENDGSADQQRPLRHVANNDDNATSSNGIGTAPAAPAQTSSERRGGEQGNGGSLLGGLAGSDRNSIDRLGTNNFNDGGRGNNHSSNKLSTLGHGPNSKRFSTSPASAAETGSTCSISTATSRLGRMGGGGTSTWGGGGGSLAAVGTLATTAAVVGGTHQQHGMNHSSSRRNAKNHQLTRQERRTLRRQRRERRNQSPAVVLRQLQTLSTTLGASFGLFLLFYLNLPALLFLMTTMVIGAITATIAYRYAILQYNAILSSGGFIQFLPEGVQASLRDALSGTTLHEWMTDPAFFMEYRYLMLYFIPGLDAEQLDAMVDRLPERHRRVLRRRGYMSSMTPAAVRRALIANDGEDEEDDDGNGNAGALQAIAAASSAEDDSDVLHDGARRQLFGEGEENESDGSNNNDDSYEPSTAELLADIAATVSSVLQGSAVGQRALGVIQEEEADNDGNSTDGGLVIEQISSTGTSDGQEQRQCGDLIWDGEDDESVERSIQGESTIPPTVTTLSRQASSQRGGLNASGDDSSLASHDAGQIRSSEVIARPRTPQPPQSPEEEQQIEGEILNDAATTMVQNYINAATDAATSTARGVVVGAVEFLTPGIVRLGVTTSVFSGLGLFGSYYMNFVRGHPLGWRRPLPRFTGGISSGGDGDEREIMTSTARYVTYGLMSSAFLGGASAGFMLLVRSGVRRTIAAERAKNEMKPDESD